MKKKKRSRVRVKNAFIVRLRGWGWVFAFIICLLALIGLITIFFPQIREGMCRWLSGIQKVLENSHFHMIGW